VVEHVDRDITLSEAAAYAEPIKLTADDDGCRVCGHYDPR
jgi:hypothetical protein